MKTRLFLTFLGFICFLNKVKSQCDLGDRKVDEEFPDIMKYSVESYVMGVEYTVTGASQTDYYTEYYDSIFRKGRVDSHITGENKKFIYQVDTWEAWTLEKRKCDLQNITETADFFKDFQSDWLHFTDSDKPSTIGPSAMFKVAYDTWNSSSRGNKMAYMGEAEIDIRGETVIYWRRCLDENKYVDYYFADETVENPFDTDIFDRIITPLRVSFIDPTVTKETAGTKDQIYDIMSFQHFIPAGVDPFALPKGRNCQRGTLLDDVPDLPNFSSQSLFLSAEVIYEKYSTKDDGYDLASSYYSTLMFALDRQVDHLAYLYSSWNTTKPDEEHKEPFLNSPYYVIFDMIHAYTYNISYETGKCEIARRKNFVPQYKLPEKGGSLDLTNPYVLFPNNELSFLSEGEDRGLPVNIFEAKFDFLMNSETLINNVVATHSYLKNNEELETTATIKNAPTQIQLRLNRFENIEEVVTFNIFGFTTRINNKQLIFDITRCFKNDDDYSFLTIGFEIPPVHMDKLSEIENQIPDIELNVLNEITLHSELNAVRVPVMMSDIKSNNLYITMLILEKPPLYLDFIEDKGKTISVSSEDDTQGVSEFDVCATNCLETRYDCWAFSKCGGTCYYGSEKNTEVKTKTNCTLYKRYTNATIIQSKDRQINNILAEIEENGVKAMVFLKEGMIELEATSAQVTRPDEDESLFEKMGNKVNRRMKVYKTGKKLKKEIPVKNMGKLRYDECQSLCLDFKDCETISYCMINSKCTLSTKFGGDLKPDDIETDELCTILTRKYTDNFDVTPGVFVKVGGGTKKDATEVEDCARACLKETSFKCLSFDHCFGAEKEGCILYTTHYLNPKSRHEVQDKHIRCGHYSRKFSNDFSRKDDTRVIGSKIPPIMNLTLEECAKTCIDYGSGACYGYDFCQDKTLYASSCILFDTDPSRMKSAPSDICTNYARTQGEYAPRPYTNGYAGGIGFLCFMVGTVVGALVVFAIAYIRVNRR